MSQFSDRAPNATIILDVYPIGRPGSVAIEVSTTGKVKLSDAEILVLLRQTIEAMESEC